MTEIDDGGENRHDGRPNQNQNDAAERYGFGKSEGRDPCAKKKKGAQRDDSLSSHIPRAGDHKRTENGTQSH